MNWINLCVALLLCPLLTIHGVEVSTPPTAGFDLGQIFRFYGSDKDTNGYTSIYHILFDHLKEKPITLLEVGIGTMIPGVHSSMVGYAGPSYRPGGSLRAWRDYFPNGEIHGVDVQLDTRFEEPRITTHLCNSLHSDEVEALMETLGDTKFDIIIDDGSHYDLDQMQTLLNFYPYLKEGGIYVIEDIYPSSRISGLPSRLATLCNGDPYVFVGVENNICVIYKNHLDRRSSSYKY